MYLCWVGFAHGSCLPTQRSLPFTPSGPGFVHHKEVPKVANIHGPWQGSDYKIPSPIWQKKNSLLPVPFGRFLKQDISKITPPPFFSWNNNPSRPSLALGPIFSIIYLWLTWGRPGTLIPTEISEPIHRHLLGFDWSGWMRWVHRIVDLKLSIFLGRPGNMGKIKMAFVGRKLWSKFVGSLKSSL